MCGPSCDEFPLPTPSTIYDVKTFHTQTARPSGKIAQGYIHCGCPSVADTIIATLALEQVIALTQGAGGVR